MIGIQEGGTMGFQSAKVVVDERFDTRINDSAVNAARKKFTPEFMNRIDKTVVFNTLRSEHLKQILDIELNILQHRVLATTNQFVFRCSDEVKDKILSEGTDTKYGARHLKRVIERNLTYPLANLVATGQIILGDSIRIDLQEDEFIFTRENEGSLIPVLIEKYGSTPGRPIVNSLPTGAVISPTPATAPRRGRTNVEKRDPDIIL
jgi:ATP-dependent Clp protease ATP-binding subunit ClpA